MDISLEDTVFSIIDTETTGTDPETDKVIECAAVKWKINEEFLGMPAQWTIDPQRLIHPSAMAIHHILQHEVDGKPTMAMVQPEIEAYTKDTVLVAHNAPFDISMMPFLKDQPTICSLRLARHVWERGALNNLGQNLTSHKSQELRYWLGFYQIDTLGLAAHRAAADILVTGHVFGALLQRYIDIAKGKTLKDLIDFVKSPLPIKALSFGKHEGVPLADVDTGYYRWMMNQIHSGKMKLDADIMFAINHALAKRGINPADLIEHEGKAGSWKDASARRHVTPNSTDTNVNPTILPTEKITQSVVTNRA